MFRSLLFAAAAGGVVVSPTPEPPFHRELKRAATDYFSWARVDDEARWAPFLCRAPKAGQAYPSTSNDATTHGQKLYSLFAKDRDAYVAIARTKVARPGQVVVKQSWLPEEVTGKDADAVREHLDHPSAFIKKVPVVVTPRPQGTAETPWSPDDHFFPYAAKDGRVYKAAKQADLFVMMKLAPATPDTDAGWVYGTVTPDGKTVTSAGRIASCMKCHAEAKHDRLFGPTAGE
jgi:hypothetical protein